jgi:hypothetical protein
MKVVLNNPIGTNGIGLNFLQTDKEIQDLAECFSHCHFATSEITCL